MCGSFTSVIVRRWWFGHQIQGPMVRRKAKNVRNGSAEALGVSWRRPLPNSPKANPAKHLHSFVQGSGEFAPASTSSSTRQSCRCRTRQSCRCRSCPRLPPGHCSYAFEGAPRVWQLRGPRSSRTSWWGAAGSSPNAVLTKLDEERMNNYASNRATKNK